MKTYEKVVQLENWSGEERKVTFTEMGVKTFFKHEDYNVEVVVLDETEAKIKFDKNEIELFKLDPDVHLEEEAMWFWTDGSVLRESDNIDELAVQVLALLV